MKRKWVVLMCALPVLLILAGLVYACQGGGKSSHQKGKGDMQHAMGKVTGVNSSAKTFTLQPGNATEATGGHHGGGKASAGAGSGQGHHAQAAGSAATSFTVTDGETRISEGREPKTFADIQVGENVIVGYEAAGGNNMARMIHIESGDKTRGHGKDAGACHASTHGS